MPLSKDGNAEMHVLPVPLTLLSAISTLRVSLPNDLRQPEPRRSTLLTLKVITPPPPHEPSSVFSGVCCRTSSNHICCIYNVRNGF